MKNILKKVSLLSSAALVALGLSAPMASAAAPTSSDPGALYGNTSIGKANPSPIELTLMQPATYDGTAKQVITAVTQGAPAGGTLYLRVANSEGALPSAGTDWVQYDPENSATSLANNDLKRTNAGTYHVYYWVDGGNNYNDVTTTPQP